MKSLPAFSRYTYRRHLPAELLFQVYAGAAVALFDIVARKEMGASTAQISVIYTVQHLAALLSVFWGSAMAGRSKKRFLAAAGILGPGMLLGMPFASAPLPYVLLCALSMMSDPILVPFRNRLIQTNYAPDRRGAIWARIFSYGRLASIGSAVTCSLVLDHWPGSHRFIFPAAGLVGIGSIGLYGRIRPRRMAAPPRPRAPWWRAGIDILRENGRFAWFEGAFMTYGTAFMLLLPLHVVLVNDVLRLTYTQASVLRQVIPPVVIALAIPFVGRLQDRKNPVRIGAYGFLLLAAFPLLMMVSAWKVSVPAAAAAYVVFGIGMSFLQASWELGPTWFAGRADSSAFMGVHLTCVGIRGTLFPQAGSFLFGLWGLLPVFALSGGLFAAAAAVMFPLMRRVESDGPTGKAEGLFPGIPAPGATRLPPRGS